MLLRRLVLTAASAGAIGLATLGVVLTPICVVVALVLAALGGPLAFALARQKEDETSPRRARHTVVAGSVVAGVTGGVVLVIAGMTVLFGAATVPVLFAGAIALSPWAWPRARPFVERYRARRAPLPPGASEPALGPLPEPARGSRFDTISTAALCARWQSSYHSLHHAHDSTARDELTALRRDCFDELERRDPRGVAHWLAHEPRPAVTSPLRHLTVLPVSPPSPDHAPRDPHRN